MHNSGLAPEQPYERRGKQKKCAWTHRAFDFDRPSRINESVFVHDREASSMQYVSVEKDLVCKMERLESTMPKEA